MKFCLTACSRNIQPRWCRWGLERWPHNRKVGVRIPAATDREKSWKQVVTAPMLNARQYMWVSRVLGDNHYKRVPSRCGTLKNPQCSMAMTAEHRLKFAVLHRLWWRLRMIEKFSSETINPKQTNKQTQHTT